MLVHLFSLLATVEFCQTSGNLKLARLMPVQKRAYRESIIDHFFLFGKFFHWHDE
jgi:hypothetical protein